MNSEEYFNNIATSQQRIKEVNTFSRDLLGYNLYKDGALLAELASDVFMYIDNDTEHDTEYCYDVRSVYDEGQSIASNISCAQWILMPATDLSATGTNGQIELIWDAAQSADVLGYNIYRDGALLTSTTDVSYNDNSAIHGIEYCYVVNAFYDLGEAAPSDQECAMWEILAPEDLYAQGLDGYVHLEWTNPPMEVSLALAMNVNFLIIMEIMVPVMLIVQANVLLKHTYPGLVMDYGMMVHGVYFNCDEWNWDEGDCPEYNNASEGYSYRSEYQLEVLGHL